GAQEREPAQRTNMHALEPMNHPIEHEEEVAPGEELIAPAQWQARLIAYPYEQLCHAHFVGNLLQRLLGIANRQRHQDGPRPGRNLVDVEPEPIGKKNDLGWDRRNGVVVILAQETEINLSEG